MKFVTFDLKFIKDENRTLEDIPLEQQEGMHRFLDNCYFYLFALQKKSNLYSTITKQTAELSDTLYMLNSLRCGIYYHKDINQEIINVKEKTRIYKEIQFVKTNVTKKIMQEKYQWMIDWEKDNNDYVITEL